MRKLLISLKVVVSVLLIVFAVSSCKKNVTTTPKVKSSSVTFKATLSKTILKTTAGVLIPIKGGNLEITAAWTNFGNVNIQENSGFDGQQTGGTTGGSDNESSTETKDSANIYLPGPYAFNVVSDTITLTQVQVFPGTFKKVDLTFMVKNDAVFNGNSIVIKGQFKPTNGAAVSLVLNSKFARQIELKLAKGITVTANSKVSLAIVFSLNKWLGAVDFTKATQTSGAIIIDAAHNTSLLKAFEAALSNQNQGMELNEGYGSSTDTGTETSDSSGDSSDSSGN